MHTASPAPYRIVIDVVDVHGDSHGQADFGLNVDGAARTIRNWWDAGFGVVPASDGAVDLLTALTAPTVVDAHITATECDEGPDQITLRYTGPVDDALIAAAFADVMAVGNMIPDRVVVALDASGGTLAGWFPVVETAA